MENNPDISLSYCGKWLFLTAGSLLISKICFLPAFVKSGACLQPAAVHEDTQHLLGRLSNVQAVPSCPGMMVEGGFLSELGSWIYAVRLTRLWKYSMKNSFFFFSLPLWDCLWMDGLASLFSKFWDCQTCTFSKQINSASVENIMVHFPNSCGRQASYARVDLRIHFTPVFILKGVVKKKGLITGFSPVWNLAGFMLIL